MRKTEFIVRVLAQYHTLSNECTDFSRIMETKSRIVKRYEELKSFLPFGDALLQAQEEWLKDYLE